MSDHPLTYLERRRELDASWMLRLLEGGKTVRWFNRNCGCEALAQQDRLHTGDTPQHERCCKKLKEIKNMDDTNIDWQIALHELFQERKDTATTDIERTWTRLQRVETDAPSTTGCPLWVKEAEAWTEASKQLWNWERIELLLVEATKLDLVYRLLFELIRQDDAACEEARASLQYMHAQRFYVKSDSVSLVSRAEIDTPRPQVVYALIGHAAYLDEGTAESWCACVFESKRDATICANASNSQIRLAQDELERIRKKMSSEMVTPVTAEKISMLFAKKYGMPHHKWHVEADTVAGHLGNKSWHYTVKPLEVR